MPEEGRRCAFLAVGKLQRLLGLVGQLGNWYDVEHGKPGAA